METKARGMPDDPPSEHGPEFARASDDVYGVCNNKEAAVHKRRARAGAEGEVERAGDHRGRAGAADAGRFAAGRGTGLARAGAAEALEGFLEEAIRLAESQRFPEGYRFDRDELYEDRA